MCVKKFINIFNEINIDDVIQQLNIFFINFQRETIFEYFTRFFNDLNIVQDFFDIDKTQINCVIALLLMINDRRFKMLNFINYIVDEFVLWIVKQIKKLKKRYLNDKEKSKVFLYLKNIFNKKIVQFHVLESKQRIWIFENETCLKKTIVWQALIWHCFFVWFLLQYDCLQFDLKY